MPVTVAGFVLLAFEVVRERITQRKNETFREVDR
jgi:hypothetical protein